MAPKIPAPTPGHDLASELLMGMRLVGVKYRRIEMDAPFGLAFGNAPGRAQFHFIGRGPVLLRTPSGQEFPLATGDALLLPPGRQHELRSAPDVAGRGIDVFSCTHLCSSVRAVTSP